MSSLLLQSELQGILDQAFRENGQLRTGNNYKFHCPFCSHRKRKLEICLDTYVWNCWVCGSKGRSIYSLFKKMQVQPSLTEKLKKIIPYNSDSTQLKKSNIELFSPFSEKKIEPQHTLQLPIEFSSLLEPNKSFGYQSALKYAKKRGISKWDIIKYNIGYCDSGEYKDRLIFPSYDENNKLNFFTGRSYHVDTYLKYKNPEVDRNIIGFENLIDFSYPISLCEGPLDAIAIKRNAIPLFGKTMSQKLKQIISTDKVSEVFIVLDSDALKMAIKHADFLLAHGKTVKLVNLNGKDPNVLGFEETTRQLRETPEINFSELMKLKLKI